MNNTKIRVDKLVVAVGKIKDSIVAHESGEIYLTWKGGSVIIKETHYVPVNEDILTNSDVQTYK